MAALALAGCGAPQRATHARADAQAKPREVAASAAEDAARRRAADPTLAAVSPEAAEALNAERPFDAGPIRPMRPFILKAGGVDHERAVECLTDAIYYEAAREPEAGQEAVAQVVLNRVRHPAWPKTVCGVVFQGSARSTGCQFTFTCDGAMRWSPDPVLWRRAEKVARRALAGFVDADVGSATHYHAAYVAPYWAPQLAKMTQVGQHIFYRWEGAWGQPGAFTGQYRGRETMLGQDILNSDAPPVPQVREVTLKSAGGERTYRVAEAAQPGKSPEKGVLRASRPAASPEQIREINARLAALEVRLEKDAPPATP